MYVYITAELVNKSDVAPPMATVQPARARQTARQKQHTRRYVKDDTDTNVKTTTITRMQWGKYLFLLLHSTNSKMLSFMKMRSRFVFSFFF